MKEIVLRGLRAAWDIILPRKCLVCGRRLNRDEAHLCLGCHADMPRTFFWNRSHNEMADRFNERIQNCGSAEGEHYAFAAALFFYHSEADYRHIPYQIKYHGNIPAGLYFGSLLGKKLASSDLFSDVDIVSPVPLHWSRRWKRGYNQAEVIAKAVAREIDAELQSGLLRRIRYTETQTKVGVEAKTANVSGSFKVDYDAASEILESGKDIRHLLIIDDVFTTGSTLHACFVALRSVFPPSVRISVATLAFVGH